MEHRILLILGIIIVLSVGTCQSGPASSFVPNRILFRQLTRFGPEPTGRAYRFTEENHCCPRPS